ncbi:hypothetical protein AC578_5363 [Pseudocercospora eumusae]|uniref:Uncharacterized protein n=1 Tax=Pseudocercospora eumusae TaxID=321146 RepID=A0A139HK21_9PEZI|nr:hypothetical protein AC578_5363 [Pseudocercospora eumusae]KXT02833.1 hypothetical protein AC578_5363 [Pseudocercospora eumusae]
MDPPRSEVNYESKDAILLQDCDNLVSKVSRDCRDATNALQQLTGSMEQFRDIPETVVDILRSHPEKEIPSRPLVMCRMLLERLDVALVSYKCSPGARFDEKAIESFKTAIESLIEDLQSAYKAMGGNSKGAAQRDSSSSLSSSGVVTETVLHPLSACSTGTTCTDTVWSEAKSSACDAESIYSSSLYASSIPALRVISQEKEVLLPTFSRTTEGCTRNARSSLSLKSAGTAGSWHSISASPDPLSLPFDDACRKILAEDDNYAPESSLTRSPRSSSSVSFQDARSRIDSDSDEEGKQTSKEAHEGESCGTSDVDPPDSSQVPVQSTAEASAGSTDADCEEKVMTPDDADRTSTSKGAERCCTPPPVPPRKRGVPAAGVEQTPSTSGHRDGAPQPPSHSIDQTLTTELRDKQAVPLVTISEPPPSPSGTRDEGEPKKPTSSDTTSPDASRNAGCNEAIADSEHSTRPRASCQDDSEPPIRNSTDSRPRKLDIREIKNSWLMRKNIGAKNTVQVVTDSKSHFDKTGRQLRKINHESQAKQSTPCKADKRQRNSLAEQHAAWISTECLRVGPSTLPHRKDVPDLIDNGRILAIEHCWNRRDWDRAELYLLEHLIAMRRLHDKDRIRRVKHLLAICSSFRGEWDDAIERFVTVLRKPIRRISDLDNGDRAAAYWLGDLYAMQNRRSDASLAYAIAAHIPPNSDQNGSEMPSRRMLLAEQDVVQLDTPPLDIAEAYQSPSSHYGSPGLFDEAIITQNAAKACLDRNATIDTNLGSMHDSIKLVRHGSRASCLESSNHVDSLVLEHLPGFALEISVSSFDPKSQWPLPYDPYFSIANIQRGRLLKSEGCDMHEIFSTNPDAINTIPRRLKNPSFTHPDLLWLIQATRKCLQNLEIEYSEVVNFRGSWWVCRYSFLHRTIATTHYFSIALFRRVFRSAHFGVHVGDMCSARILPPLHVAFPKGVHYLEPKRVRAMVFEFLKEEAEAAESCHGNVTSEQQVRVLYA